MSSKSIVRAVAGIIGKRKGEGEPTRRDGLVTVPDYERESNSVIHVRGVRLYTLATTNWRKGSDTPGAGIAPCRSMSALAKMA